MNRRPPRSTLTDTLFPYTTLFRSKHRVVIERPKRAQIDHFRVDALFGKSRGRLQRNAHADRIADQRDVAALADDLGLADRKHIVIGPGHVEALPIEQLRSEEHTSELQSLMRISYAVFCLKNKKTKHTLPREKHNTTS